MDFKKGKVIKHTQLTADTFQLDIKPTEPLPHLAGQFVTIKIPNQEKLTMRAYSIASKPGMEHFELCIKAVEGGTASNWLSALQEDKDIEFIGPAGAFTFKTTPNKSVLLIATGTGIAPIKSILEDELVNKDSKQNFELIFGLRHVKDVFYQDPLEKLAQDFPNFKYSITLSRPEDESWAGLQGRVTDYMQNLELDPQSTESYACGLKPMIEETTSLLQAKGLPEEAIHHEKFG